MSMREFLLANAALFLVLTAVFSASLTVILKPASIDVGYAPLLADDIALFADSDCSRAEVICVYDTAGATQEARPSGGFYDTIQ